MLLLALLPLLASALVICGIVDANPELLMSGLATSAGGAFINGGGTDWFDPTIGVLTQPFGALSAQDWLHFVVPWWNPYTALGMPLAAEMQSLSFFLPFVFLLLSPHGWIALKLLLQMASGMAFYALLTELEFSRIAAFVPAALFALNGTFFFVPHAVGPLPFLPLLLLGVEHAARAAQGGGRRGWGLIPFALAYSIYAGYPEIAFLDGMLAAVWVAWRFFTLGAARWVFAGKVAGGVALGLALALPLVVPFFQFVGLSYLGAHQAVFAVLGIGRNIAPAVLFPFFYGPAGVGDARTLLDWFDLGGWFGAPAVVLALAGLARPGRYAGLAYTMLGFVLFWLLRCWGFPPAVFVADLIPFVARTDAVRFIWPAMEAAMFILAGIGLQSWLAGGFGKARLGVVALLAVLLTAVAVLPNLAVAMAWFGRAPSGRLDLAAGLTGCTVLVAALLLVLLGRAPGRRVRGIAAALVALDALVTAFVPQLSAPRHVPADISSVTYLRAHLGLGRFYTLLPFAPDEPAGFGLASINDNALPIPRAWADYLHAHLDPFADVVIFNGVLRQGGAGPDAAAALRANLAAYEAVGVRYVLAPPGREPFLPQADVGGGIDGAVVLSGGQSAAGSVPAALVTLPRVSAVGVMLATFAGRSSGRLDLQLCTAAGCASGGVDLSRAGDNKFATISLSPALPVPASGALRYVFRHAAGGPVALWLAPAAPGGPAGLGLDGHPPGVSPLLRFYGEAAAAGVAMVFQDQATAIYRLPDTRPYFSTAPACALHVADRNHVAAQCAGPAVLTRLEAFYPGWRARVNGRDVAPAETGGIFQAVPLPAGRSLVTFTYRPAGTRLSVGLALAALLLWLGLVVRSRLSGPASVVRARRG